MDTVFIKRIPKSQVLVTREILIEMKEVNFFIFLYINKRKGEIQFKTLVHIL